MGLASARVGRLTHGALSRDQLDTIVSLCTRAYDEDFASYVASWLGGEHVLLTDGGHLLAHALWIPRPLYREGLKPLVSAYVEAVATDPDHQGRGYAGVVMRAVGDAVQTFEIAALSPSDHGFYARFGWETWRGRLFAVCDGHWTVEEGEEAMILRTPKTPPLDLSADLGIDWRPGEVW